MACLEGLFLRVGLVGCARVCDLHSFVSLVGIGLDVGGVILLCMLRLRWSLLLLYSVFNLLLEDKVTRTLTHI